MIKICQNFVRSCQELFLFLSGWYQTHIFSRLCMQCSCFKFLARCIKFCKRFQEHAYHEICFGDQKCFCGFWMGIRFTHLFKITLNSIILFKKFTVMFQNYSALDGTSGLQKSSIWILCASTFFLKLFKSPTYHKDVVLCGLKNDWKNTNWYKIRIPLPTT